MIVVEHMRNSADNYNTQRLNGYTGECYIVLKNTTGLLLWKATYI